MKIPRSISHSPLHFMLFRGKLIAFVGEINISLFPNKSHEWRAIYKDICRYCVLTAIQPPVTFYITFSK